MLVDGARGICLPRVGAFDRWRCASEMSVLVLMFVRKEQEDDRLLGAGKTALGAW